LGAPGILFRIHFALSTMRGECARSAALTVAADEHLPARNPGNDCTAPQQYGHVTVVA
jgi:hypothetical protein